MEGPGVLKLSETDSPEQQRCIKVKELFNKPKPDLIEADFDQGTPYLRANLTWNKLGLKLETHIKHGMAHGMFKIETDDENNWMIGNFIKNKVDGPCWIITEKQVHIYFLIG
jgi:hypothetical protein